MSKPRKILDQIDSPADLKKLNQPELASLANEIREQIIQTVSRTGGHLASNLGVVELAIALHRVFNSPEDKILWDVGHQSYPHKILTGRKNRFETLRQDGGICGYVRRDESEHDPFGTGHASTAISAALGIAKARDLRGGKESVVAVIGDGALTGGLALEGLNNAGDLKTDLIVVLNDNEMSIAENVTAMALHLAKLRMAPLYQRVESSAKSRLQNLPLGEKIARTAEGLSHGITHLLASKTGIVFEELGFTYLGPIDGHNIALMEEMFENARNIRGPILIHVVTIKGKGYEYAESDSRQFHGIAGFTIADGKIEKTNGNITFTQAFSDAIVELAEQDPRIVAITAAMPDGTGLSEFARRFPDRFYDVGIAEEHAVTFAAGLAAGGLKPVVAIYSTFLQRSYDQILHDVCLQRLPVTFAIDRAGIVGEDGPTHHGVYDLSYLRHMPGMTIAAPCDASELRNLLATALTHDGPMAVRYPRGESPVDKRTEGFETTPIGKGRILRDGCDAAIIAVGPTVYTALEASDILSNDGFNVMVIDARFIKPLDDNLILETAKTCGRILVLEENSIIGGFGSGVLELLTSKDIKIPVRLTGVPDCFIDHGSTDSLRKAIGLAADKIAAAVQELINSNRTVYFELDS